MTWYINSWNYVFSTKHTNNLIHLLILSNKKIVWTTKTFHVTRKHVLQIKKKPTPRQTTFFKFSHWWYFWFRKPVLQLSIFRILNTSFYDSTHLFMTLCFVQWTYESITRYVCWLYQTQRLFGPSKLLM